MKYYLMKNITAPNIISFIRILMVPVVIYFYLSGQLLIALILFIISAISDFFDGFLARKFNQTTQLGAILDPFADRLFVISVLVFSLFHPLIPPIAATVLIAREILVALFQLLLGLSGHKTIKVYFLGKASTALIYFSIPLYIFSQIIFSESLEVFTNAILLVGVILYVAIGAVYITNSIKTFYHSIPATE
jgi:cardiolipin synthase